MPGPGCCSNAGVLKTALIALLAALLAVGASACTSPHDPSADDQADNLDPDGTGKADVPLGWLPPLTRIYDDGQIAIDSEVSHSHAEIAAFVARIRAAYQYAATAHQWSDPAKIAAPFTVKLITVAAMRSTMPGVAALCASANVIVITEKLVPDGIGDGTLAHELTHLQHRRIAGIPNFLEEGTAQDIQRAYSLMLGEDAAKFTAEAQLLGSVDERDARDVIDHFRTGPDLAAAQHAGLLTQDESLGCLFVEFLRTRYLGGYADVLPRVAWILELMPPGLVKTAPGFDPAYRAAFTTAFGIAAEAAEASFVAYVRATDGDQAGRLRGTLFDGY
jgi:hypothetical protein